MSEALLAQVQLNKFILAHGACDGGLFRLGGQPVKDMVCTGCGASTATIAPLGLWLQEFFKIVELAGIDVYAVVRALHAGDHEVLDRLSEQVKTSPAMRDQQLRDRLSEN
jgi:hypothetical protein